MLDNQFLHVSNIFSKQYDSDNVNNSFTNTLPTDLNLLSDQYEIALVGGFLTVDKRLLRAKNTRLIQVLKPNNVITNLYFNEPEEYNLDQLMTAFNLTVFASEKIGFLANEQNTMYILRSNNNLSLRISDTLAKILKLPSQHLKIGAKVDSLKLSLTHTILINCNLVKPQIIGSSYKKVLSVLNIKSDHEGLLEITNPRYVDLECQNFRKINIMITNLNDELVSLEPLNSTLLVLHLRLKE